MRIPGCLPKTIDTVIYCPPTEIPAERSFALSPGPTSRLNASSFPYLNTSFKDLLLNIVL